MPGFVSLRELVIVEVYQETVAPHRWQEQGRGSAVLSAKARFGEFSLRHQLFGRSMGSGGTLPSHFQAPPDPTQSGLNYTAAGISARCRSARAMRSWMASLPTATSWTILPASSIR